MAQLGQVNGAVAIVDRRNRIEWMFGPTCMIDCINSSIATERAEAVVDASGVGASGRGGSAFFAGSAQLYLARYLLAAAILGEGAATIVDWVRTGDPQPWDALAGRPDVVPEEWAGTRDEIAQMPPDQKAAVFATLRVALTSTADVS